MVLLAKTEAGASPQMRRRLAWCVPLGALCLAVAVGLLLVKPTDIIISYRMQVSEGSVVEDFLTKPMYPVILSAWLFNITNAERFQSGHDEKLKVEQVGPFTYKETRYNENFTLDVAGGVMHFSPRSRVHFAPELSAASADDVTLTLPNLAMLGVASLVSSMSSWTRMGFNLLANQLNSQPTVTVNATTYFWGYSDPILTLVHNLVPGYINFKKMGILDLFFNVSSTMEISARNEDRFMIKSRNGLKKVPMGNLKSLDECEICDDFANAYEALGFPCFVTPETPIRVFKNGLCRLLPTEFQRKITTDDGVEGLLFQLSDSFFSLDHNATNNGMLDLKDCYYGIPLAVSKAHFLDVAPEVYERVEGVPEPDPSKQSYFIIEPVIAMELETVVRVQLNLVLPDLGFSSRAGRYSRMTVPVAYLEFMQPPLPAHTQRALHLMYVIVPPLTRAAVALLVLAGLALLAHPIVLYLVHKHWRTDKIVVISTQEPLLQSQSRIGCKQ